MIPSSPVWHPFTQMQTAPTPITVVKGDGAWLITEDGHRFLDMVSSWWVTLHGHAHPYIARAVAEQAATLEQVIFAGFTHPQAERLARRMVDHLPGRLQHVFFSDDGSTAVEVALKMAWQYWVNRGESRKRVIALQDAYHGDTFGAMAMSGRSLFTKPFEPLLFDVSFLPSPADADMKVVLDALYKAHEEGGGAALIVEPLLQAAGGMKMYSPEQLTLLVKAARELGILVIFDEVMTGFCRTGRLFAMDHLSVAPDIACFSKGLTGGFLPMSLTCCSAEVYGAFLSDEKSKTLFHGHSFTANPIACAAANASLDLIEAEDHDQKLAGIVDALAIEAEAFRGDGRYNNIRQCGTVLAMDLPHEGEKIGYLFPTGHTLAARLMEQGLFMRPLGDVLYFMPPLCTTPAEIAWAGESIRKEWARL